MTELRPLSDDWDQTGAALPVTETTFSIAAADKPGVGLLAAALALNLTLFAYVVARAFVRQPYSDMFDYLQPILEHQDRGGWLGYLWSLHNGQHLVWVRALTVLDVWLGGTALVFATASTLAVMLAAALVGYVLWRTIPARGLGAAAGLLSGMLIVSTVNAEDCTQPINAVYAICFGLAVVAIVLLESPGWKVGGRAGVTPPAALIAAFGAVLGNGAGLAVWPVLALGAWRNRTSRWVVAAAIAGGGALIVLYLHDSHGIAPAQPVVGGLRRIGRMAEYFLLYCGAPWSLMRVLKPARVAIGAVVALVGLVSVVRGPCGAGQAGRIERIGLDLIAFALLTAVMAAIGRVDESANVVVPVRYAIFMSAFDVGVVCIIAGRMSPAWPTGRGRALPAAVLVAIVLLGEQAAAGASLIRSSDHVRAIIAAFNAGQHTPEMLTLVHPNPGFAARVTQEYRARGLYR